ncbi:hypothetical protein GOEFS_096_00300 [Gordonia effusa NBRC 100432]|uniref:DUF559 domain-containing protein n=1 Tax=Gordonia effusa NBRC 100432 TaxID=1077974 RepID=H0R452_9ACTN|nr:hypothetical protein [Gordonia effusa]GAB19853.1 hypothetical protein GOEFS_096_00300 [Gordonia effusa NBRC 100432]
MDELAPGVFRAKEFKRRFHATYEEIFDAAVSGSIDRLRHGWYATPNSDAAVVSAVRAGGVLSCVSALKHHGVWVAPGYDDVHVRKSRYAEEVGIRCCHAFGRVPPTPHAVDSLAVAFACAARCMTEEHWIAAVDSALNLGMTSVSRLEAAWQNTPVWVSTMLAKCDGRSQSGTESIARLRLRALNFRVQTQVSIPTVGKVDLLVGRLIIECDSEGHHGPRDQRRNDYRRDRKALIGRWLCIRVDYQDILYNWPTILADIRMITSTDLHRRRRV